MPQLIMIFFLLSLLACIYMFVRNNQVFKFRNKINVLCYQWTIETLDARLEKYPDLTPANDNHAWKWFYETLPSYNEMVLSFKPLKLEYWADAQLIKKLLNKEL